MVITKYDVHAAIGITLLSAGMSTLNRFERNLSYGITYGLTTTNRKVDWLLKSCVVLDVTAASIAVIVKSAASIAVTVSSKYSCYCEVSSKYSCYCEVSSKYSCYCEVSSKYSCYCETCHLVMCG